MMTFDVTTAGVFGALIEADVLPTPRLVDEGTRHPVEAYRTGEYNGRGVWRVRDDSYDPPGTEYRLVRLVNKTAPMPW